MRTIPTLFATISLLFVAACGDDNGGQNERADAGFDCTQESRADTWAVGLEKTGDNGYAIRVAVAAPTTPQKGDQAWTLQVVNPSGTLVDGATVTVTPMMPDHGHGTPVKAVITPVGSEGKYEVTPVNLWMPGFWKIDVAITDGAASDTPSIGVCIDQ